MTLRAESIDSSTAWLPIQAGIVRRRDSVTREYVYAIEDTDGRWIGEILERDIPQVYVDAFDEIGREPERDERPRHHDDSWCEAFNREQGGER